MEKPCIARGLSLCKLPLTVLLISHAGRAKHLTTASVAVAIENLAVPTAAKRGIMPSRAGIEVNNDNLEVTGGVVLLRLSYKKTVNKFVILPLCLPEPM